jgi:hypothetical protein
MLCGIIWWIGIIPWKQLAAPIFRVQELAARGKWYGAALNLRRARFKHVPTDTIRGWIRI